ncbi:hypothetical protein QUF99_16740 [Bacillus sp. DX4.1]|uniref:hypothetical protein n=1 Tax=Bacillus sp. DX4.1 TaxID=3055867 RepID=UPI00259FE1C7|nr:hypothetical protein [Bacillus sp. DX4.1]MDM5188905.1 hypothetical protein [Bacillus sp. DX4.1]
MKKQKKKRTKFRWFIWISIIPFFLFTLFLGLHGLKMERWHHEKHQALVAQSEGQAYFSQREKIASFEDGGKHHKQEHKENDYEHHGKHHEEEFDGMFFILLLIELSSVLLGWFTLRKAEGRTIRKWIGILLIVIGLLPILPLLAIITCAIWLYKQRKQKQETAHVMIDYTADSYSIASSNTASILDQWEKQIRKEEK